MDEKNSKLKELKEILFEEAKKQSIRDPINCVPKNKYDQVLERCYLSDLEIAQNKPLLKELGITHVLNAAKGHKISQINTNQAYYDELDIKFLGFNLMDVDTCKIEVHFERATEFIHEALSQSNGKILVHCYMGVSRSATFILAYLIKYKGMKLSEAIRKVFLNRLIWPNDGFLLRLIEFEKEFIE